MWRRNRSKRSGSRPELALALLLCAAPAAAQTPDTDIWVAPLSLDGGTLHVGAPRNITARVGYDNQPHFTADGSAILYTRQDDAGQTDIWRYDLARGVAAQVTRTAPESEYSATPLPDGTGFSVIRVERDSTQRLWRFDHDGSNARVVYDRIAPVGYHAWADDHRAAMFILGSPATLQVGDTRTGAAEQIAANIGRAIQRVPGRNAITFVQMAAGEGMPQIRMLDLPTGTVTDVAPVAAEDAEYHVWHPSGLLIAAAGAKLLVRDERSGSWRTVADFTEQGLTLSRLAISPDGTRIALVATRAQR